MRELRNEQKRLFAGADPVNSRIITRIINRNFAGEIDANKKMV